MGLLSDEPSLIGDSDDNHGDAVETSVVAVRWELQRSAAGSAEFFTKNAGPIQLALGRLDAPKQAALLHDFANRQR